MSRLPHLPLILISLIVLSLDTLAYDAYTPYFLIGDFSYDATEYGGRAGQLLGVAKYDQFCEVNVSDGTDVNCVDKPWSGGNAFLYVNPPKDPADSSGTSKFMYIRPTETVDEKKFLGINSAYVLDWWSDTPIVHGISPYGYSQLALDSFGDILLYDAYSTQRILELQPRYEDNNIVPSYERQILTYDVNAITAPTGTVCFIGGVKNTVAYLGRFKNECKDETSSYTSNFAQPASIQLANGFGGAIDAAGVMSGTENSQHTMVIAFYTADWHYIEYSVHNIVGGYDYSKTPLSNNIRVSQLDGDEEVVVSTSGNNGKALLIFDYDSNPPYLTLRDYYRMDDANTFFGTNSTVLRDVGNFNGYGEDEVILARQSGRWDIDRFTVLGFDDTVNITPSLSSSNTKRRRDTTRDSIVGGYAYSELPLNLTNQGTLPVRKVRIYYDSTGLDAGDGVYFNAEVHDIPIISPGCTNSYIIRYENSSVLRKSLPAELENYTDSSESVAGGDAFIRANIEVSNSDVIAYNNARLDSTGADDGWCKSGWSFRNVTTGYLTVPAGGSTKTSGYPVFCNKSGKLPALGLGWRQDSSQKTIAGGRAYTVGDVNVTNYAEIALSIISGQATADSAGRGGWTCGANASHPGVSSLGSGMSTTLFSSLLCHKENVINASGVDWFQLNASFEADREVTIRGTFRVTNTDTIDYNGVVYNASTIVRDDWDCSIDGEGVLDISAGQGKTNPGVHVSCTGIPVVQNPGARVQDFSHPVIVGNATHSKLTLEIENTDSVDYENVSYQFDSSPYDGFDISGQTQGTVDIDASDSESYDIYFSKLGLVVFEDRYESATEGYVLNVTVRNNDSIDYVNVTVPISINESKLKGAPINLTVFWDGSWEEITPNISCDEGNNTFGNITSCMSDSDGNGWIDALYVLQPNSSEAKYHIGTPDFSYSTVQGIELYEGNETYCNSSTAFSISSSKVYGFTSSGAGWVYIRKIDDTNMTVKVNGNPTAKLESYAQSTGCAEESWRTYIIPISDMGELELNGEGIVDFVGFQPVGSSLLYPENYTFITVGFSIEPNSPNITINSTVSQMEEAYTPSNEPSNFYYSIFRTNNSSSVLGTNLTFESGVPWVSPSKEIETDADYPSIGSISYPDTDLFLDEFINFSAETVDKNIYESYLEIDAATIPLTVTGNNSIGYFRLEDFGVSEGNSSFNLFAVDRVGHTVNTSVPLRLSSFSLDFLVLPRIISFSLYPESTPFSHNHSFIVFMQQSTTGAAVNISRSMNFTLSEPWDIENVTGNVSWTPNGNALELVSRNYSLHDFELIQILYNLTDAFSIVSKQVSSSEKLILIDNVTLNTSIHQVPNLFIEVELPDSVNLSNESIAISTCELIDPNDRFTCAGSWTTYQDPYELPLLMETELDSFEQLTYKILFRLRRSGGTLVRIRIQTGAQGSTRTPTYLDLSNLLSLAYPIYMTEFNFTSDSVTVGEEYEVNISFLIDSGSELILDGISVPSGASVDGYGGDGTHVFNESIIVDSEYGPLTEAQFSVRNLPLVLVEETNSSHESQSNTHTFTQGIRVLEDAVSNGSIVYNFFTSSLPDFSKRTGDPTLWVDGRQNNISWQVVGGGNIIRLIVGENFGNSSLHEGNHTVTIEYDTESGGDEGESPPGGGTPPGSGGLALIPMYANVSWPSKLSMYRDSTSELSIYIDNADGKTSTYTFNYSSEVNITPKVTSMVLNPDEIGILRFTINPQNTPLNSSLLQFTLTEVHAGQKTYAKKAFNLTLVFTDRPEVESNDTPDSTPPDITTIEPANNSLINSSYFTLNLTTDENAECRYSDSLDMTFAEMSMMDSTGYTFHQHAFNLSEGANYTYYFKCRDSEGNVDAFDYGLNFTIKKQKTPDSGSGPNPNPPLIPADLNTLSLLLSLLVALAMISYQLISRREEPVILIPREKVDFIKPPVKKREMKKFGIKVPGVVEGTLVTETEKKPETLKRKEKKPVERKPEPVKEEKKPEKPVKEDPKPERKEGKGSEFGTPEELKKAEEELKKYFMEEG